VAASPPLDTNSVYCNLLQCSHFADTSVIAKRGSTILGFISGYRLPKDPETLFVWQVVVSAEARGQGLALKMLEAQVRSEACRGVRYMDTTITEDNGASRALFAKFAKRQGAEMAERPFFEKDRHFDGRHESEYLIRIGPFSVS